MNTSVYIATVTRRQSGDWASIYRWLDDNPPPLTNELRHCPPVYNNISYYRGAFATERDAELAIRDYFPAARF